MINLGSPYKASLTGGGFLFEETNLLLPLLMSSDRAVLIKNEILNNNVLHINSESARKRNVSEIIRRFDNMSISFWQDYNSMSEDDQRVAIFYVIMKTYKIVFDFHINITIKKWYSSSKTVERNDLMMELNEISANDPVVDSWTDKTKSKVASTYLSILRHVGMLDFENHLQVLKCSNFDYYINLGETWFLEACLLLPYQIDDIKKKML